MTDTDTADLLEQLELPMPDVARIPADLAAAVVAAWSELGTLTKDKTARIEGREGRAGFQYNYADLASLLEVARPVLAKHGLALLQPISRESATGILIIETWLVHTSGWVLRWRFAVQAAGTPQQIGSSITYGRRYSAQSALGVAAEDDDGNAATKAAAAKPAPVRKPKPATSPHEARTRKAMALFAELGYDRNDRDGRLAYTSAIVGHDVGSWNDLTPDEEDQVLDFLEQAAADEQAGQEES